MRLKDCHDQAAKKQEAEFLSKKTSEYAGHIRHLEVRNIYSTSSCNFNVVFYV